MIKILTKNIFIKIVCLLLAFVFWFSIKSEETITTTLTASVKPVITETMFVAHINPPQVEVSMAGNRKILHQLETEDHEIRTDLRSETESKVVRMELKPADFPFPEGVLITRIEPKFVNIEIDNLVQKVFDVDPFLEGEAAPNFTIAEIQTFPSRLSLTGPRKSLENVTAIKTEPINIRGLSTSFMQTVQIEEPFASFDGAEQIKVFVTINKSKEERDFQGIPIRVLQPVGPPSSVTIKPPLADIRVNGSNLDFQGIDKNSFIPYVEVSGLVPGEYELPVNVIKNDRLRLSAVNPKSVAVSIAGNR